MLMQYTPANWQQMPLFFPGPTRQPAPFFCMACKPIPYDGAARLMKAIFIQAVTDAGGSRDTDDRRSAREFLLEDGEAWAWFCGHNVTRRMIEDWAASGWPAARWRRSPNRDIEKV